MTISNYLFSPTSENPCFDKLNNNGFSVWCVPPKADKCYTMQLLITETFTPPNFIYSMDKSITE